MRVSYLQRLILIVLVFMHTGCAQLRQLVDPPKVSLANVALIEAGLLEQRYRLTLRVQNPNSVSIPVNGLNYAVKLAGVDFASGATPKSFSLAANGEDLVAIDVSTNLLDSARQLYAFFNSGADKLDYELSGNISVDMPFVKSLPFNRIGQVDISRLQGSRN